MKKILLGLIGLLFAVPAVAADLPAGYTELEYIESTGTQYIDTGIYSTDVIETMVVGQYTELSGNDSIFGVLESNGNNYYGLGLAGSGTKWRLWYGTSDSPWVIFGTPDTNKHTFLLKNKSIYIDNLDTPIAESYLSCSSQTKTMFLFGANFGGNLYTPSKAKIFSAVIKDNNSLVRNLIPAKSPTGVVGMYDTVSGNFFTNAGTGEFIAGPVIPEQQIRIATTAYNSARFSPVVTELNDTIATIRSVVTNTINQTKAIADLQATKQTRPDENCPAGKKCLLVEDNAGQPHWYEIIENAYGLPNGYTALEYIESTGTQYIDTGITPSSTKLQVNFKMQSLANTYQSFFGAVANPSPRNGYRIYRQEGNSYFSVQSGGNSFDVAANFNDPIECQTTVNNGGRATVVVNGVTSTVGSGMNTQFDRSMLIFTAALGSGDSISGTGAFKLWSFQIIKDDEEKFNGVPAKRNSDNAIGLYDTVTNTFFINQGTGTFTAGPEI
ncbi:MAG: hypothetical protein IJS34_00700 [Alphaproteobacteria bacterium]|nr:hypothetical protein [Alphaproteobacteria bacterium]